MKSVIIVAATLLIASCANESARYTDLQTGNAVKLEKDDKSGLMVDKDSRKPVYIYVDQQKHDTIFGSTGKTINGRILKTENGKYQYVDGLNNSVEVKGEMKVKDGDFKMKVDKDGDVKIKDGEKTTKIDGETGEKKTKKD